MIREQVAKQRIVEKRILATNEMIAWFLVHVHVGIGLCFDETQSSETRCKERERERSSTKSEMNANTLEQGSAVIKKVECDPEYRE